MSQQANLTCFKVDCSGEFRRVDDTSNGALFECEECGAELEQGIEKLADESGPVGGLASVLLEGIDR